MREKKVKKWVVFFTLGIISSLAILGVNFWLINPWFSGKGPANLGSIEVSYVSMARFIRDFSPHLSWGPFWYFGFPFHLFYTPLLPFLEVVVNKFTGVELWGAYRIVSGLGFILAPVSLFLFAWYLTKKIIPGFLAGILYTFLPTPFYFVLPSGEVARDIISVGSNFFDPRRLVNLVRWGEGPHTLSLAFLPLAGLFYLRVLEKRKLVDIVLTAFFFGLTALTNAVGFYATVLLLLSIFFAELVMKPKKFNRSLNLSIATALVSYGLIAFWYNLSFIGNFFGEGGGALQNYLNLFPWGYVFLFIGGICFYFLFQKVIKNRGVILSFVWFLVLFLIVYIYYTSAPPDLHEQRIELAPQALRLTTEVDMALPVFLAALLGALISFLEKKHKIGLVLGNMIGIALIVGILGYGYSYLSYGQKAVSGEVDLTQTGEYEIANWLKANVDPKKGERVYLAGNYGFYLNYFTDIWQLRGGLYQAATHPWPDHIYYQMGQGKDKEIAIAWLKVANIKYLVVNTPSSREFYKEFKYPGKFEDFKTLYQARGDIIYEVPLKATSPAKVVDLEAVRVLISPLKADDKEPLLAYASWLDKSTPADFEVINNDLYNIKATVGENEGILVQMTYDKGFRAKSKQGRVEISKDPLGFMVLTPPRAGEYGIVLSHGKTWKVWLGYLITLGTIGILVYLSLPARDKLRHLFR